MQIFENFKSQEFWVNVAKLATVFFILFVIISLVISHFSEIFSGDFETVYQEEWANGKWINYFLIKLAISFVYAVYMVSRQRSLKRKK